MLYNKFTDWESFREHINQNLNLKIRLKTHDDIDDDTQYITTLIQEACWLNIPKIKQNIRYVNLPLTIKEAVLENGDYAEFGIQAL